MKDADMDIFFFFYDTDVSSCLCGNKLMSSVYLVDILCFHGLKKGAFFPKIPHINLNFEDLYEEITFDYEIVEENEQENPAVRTIILS